MSLLLVGPFVELITMADTPLAGRLNDTHLQLIAWGGVLMEGSTIRAVGPFEQLLQDFPKAQVDYIDQPMIAAPGLVDAHTHICFAGSRVADYAMRLAGNTYEDIARLGGGIMHTVRATRAALEDELVADMRERLCYLQSIGVTCCEVKSGYGLTVADELKMLRAIAQLASESKMTIVPTCLAAHLCPPEWDAPSVYLHYIAKELLPTVAQAKLSHRVDIFVDGLAFSPEQAAPYLEVARSMGFELTVHADQFTAGGARLAAAMGARSADHLEAIGADDMRALAESNTVAVVLPGASLGLGVGFAPARQLLEAGCILAIASDWNPGSAPMGDLLVQTALLGIYEKLHVAELWAGVSCRAAAALGLAHEVGRLAPGYRAHMVAFATDDHREVWYAQGRLKPVRVWASGCRVG